MYAGIKKSRWYLFFVVALLVSAIYGCDRKPEKPDSNKLSSEKKSNEGPSVSAKPQDKLLAEFQVKLLDMAFESASSIPKDPFIKDRSNAQTKVADTSLNLDQPIRTVRYADKIESWQRGLEYANTAYYFAQKGYKDENVTKGLHLAEQIAALDHGQQWRNERIKAKIAQTYLVLGLVEKAKQYESNLADAESGHLMEQKSQAGNEQSFDDQVKSLDAMIATGSFDPLVNALGVYALLYDRFYDNPQRRDLIEQKIKKSWEHLPVFIRFNLLIKLAEFALVHSDRDKAMKLANEAQAYMDESKWPLEKYIPMMSDLVKFRVKAGDMEKARTDSDRMRSLYEAQGKNILIIDRVGAILPLAEAYQSQKNTETALSVYRLASDVCIENTNPVTRAGDLSAICCSMAFYAVEPNAELWTRIHDIAKGLGNP